MSDRETLTRLEQELKAVRAASRRDRIIFGVIAAVIGAFVVGGAGEPAQVSDEVRTRKLTVVDSKGVVRAVIEAGEKGAGLDVLGEKGDRRATVFVASNGDPMVAATDGQSAVQMKVYKRCVWVTHPASHDCRCWWTKRATAA